MGADPTRREEALRQAALGHLSGAIAMLRPLAEASGDPEDRLLIGRLALVLTDDRETRDQLERAYREFRERGLPRRAALAATWLAVHLDLLDERIAARAWLDRARRLLEPEGPCVEQGYVLVGLFGIAVASADALQENARAALAVAREFRDPNLECKALADWGLALVSRGQIAEGMAHLDEALAMITAGETRDPAVISQAVCGMINACDRSGDLARAETWLRFVEERTPAEGQGPSIHTFAQCWRALGSVLSEAGQWTEAETLLRLALARGDRSYHFARLATRAAFAELRIRQGRFEEAARLIDDASDRVEVLGPRARLHLAQGRSDLAAAVARQALRQLDGDRLRAAPLLLVLVDAELASGNVEAAGEAAEELARMAELTAVSTVAAQAALAVGRTAAARGDPDEAAERFAAGLAVMHDGAALLRAALHLALARAQAGSRPADATVNAQTAFAVYERLGAPEAASASELLRELGRPASPAPRPSAPLAALTHREREVLDLLPRGLTNPDIAQRLHITPRTAEHHVSSILSKLGLRNRSEAAAFAASFRLAGESRAGR
ncbi:helix-turn-helix transcriptional regulator [Sinomonas flava]|uniref:HTH luxR-type domain-containing protein n=1 Tax=Sinomonas flava TaxID=496857 RepID=A0ABN3C376_9MICC